MKAGAGQPAAAMRTLPENSMVSNRAFAVRHAQAEAILASIEGRNKGGPPSA